MDDYTSEGNEMNVTTDNSEKEQLFNDIDYSLVKGSVLFSVYQRSLDIVLSFNWITSRCAYNDHIWYPYKVRR